MHFLAYLVLGAPGLGYGNSTKKEEKKAGGTGWDTVRWKQDLLERTCVAMAVANFRLLDAHTRAP